MRITREVDTIVKAIMRRSLGPKKTCARIQAAFRCRNDIGATTSARSRRFCSTGGDRTFTKETGQPTDPHSKIRGTDCSRLRKKR